MTDLNFHELPAGYFLSFAVPVTSASRALDPAGALRLGGWSFINPDAANPASIELWDGSAGGGNSLAVINLAPSASLTKPMPGLGLVVRAGLFLSVTAGTVRGSVWVAPSFPGRLATAMLGPGE